MGTQMSLPKKGAEPPRQFSAHVYCGQTAGWIKMALDTEVGLGPGHIVLYGDPAPLPQKGKEPPNFRPIFIVAKRLDKSRWHLAWRWALDQATLCQMGPQLPSSKKGAYLPIFGPFLLSPIGWMHQDCLLYTSDAADE